MASSALTGSACSSGGISWQVDIPSLSQVLLNFGSHALKHITNWGVQMHIVGCMLRIGEFYPAGRPFRPQLNRARQQQRSERSWLYKTIEIGTATNGLADELLKTRAGENVLALLAATAPVMLEASCTLLLATLFEIAKISIDNIPGESEFQNLRRALGPSGSQKRLQ